MAFDISNLKNELDSVVSHAVSVADLIDKEVGIAARFAGFVPGVGAEVQTIAKLVDEADKALHALQSALNAL